MMTGTCYTRLPGSYELPYFVVLFQTRFYGCLDFLQKLSIVAIINASDGNPGYLNERIY
jgi:hypothetical protein